MNRLLWQHSLKVCFELVKKLKRNKNFYSPKLVADSGPLKFDGITDNEEDILLNFEPRESTTSLFIDATHESETGGFNTKFVLHYSKRVNNATLVIINPNVDPIVAIATHSLNPTDPVDVCATSYYEQLISTYND